MRRQLLAICLAAWTCAFLPVTAASAAETRPADTMLILDASGSMWGVVDGRSKIEAAREAVGAILSRWTPGDRIGLMVYGHRSKTDCHDIETVVPVGPFDPRPIQAAVHAINPRGRTPLTESLRQAAAALKAGGARGNIVLVSDGLETCGADPCAAAAELKKAQVGLVAHVVGFDVADPLAKAQLQCIARATGGVYLDAKNAGGLTTALTRVVEATQGRTVATEAPAKPVEDPLKGKLLRVTLRLAEGSDPFLDQTTIWELHHPGPALDEPGELIRTEYGPRLGVAEKPGDYVLKVQVGQVTRFFPVHVEPGKVSAYDFPLDAAIVTSVGAALGSGAQIAGQVEWQLKSAEGEALATAYDPVPKFIVPAGSYQMKLVKGSSSIVKEFTVAPGDAINLAITLDVARVLVDAVYAPGGDKIDEGLAVEIRKPARDAVTPGDSIETKYDAVSAFDLPSGPYEVFVTVGLVQRSLPIEVRPGEPVKVTVDMQAGFAAISAPGAETIEIFGGKKSISGQRQSLDTVYGESFDKAMAAGDYVAVVTRGGAKTETRFKVVPGERTEVEAR